MSKIAIMIPCYDEEKTIGKVIADFKEELPDATIYVYDNNSKDKTAEIAAQCGAVVKTEARRGKGNVVRAMFRDIDADIYVMIDGDDTYPSDFVHDLIAPVAAGEVDMCVGDRHSNGTYSQENKRFLHDFGNRLVKTLINRLFGADLQDIMSGYRVFNKKFVKNMAVNSEGFEIETEMTLHALDKRFKVREQAIQYRDRPEGSFSKLNTFSDGIKVLKTIMWIFKDYKPLAFFSILSILFFVIGLAIGIPVIIEFMKTGLIYKIPSAVLATGLMLISVLLILCGFILDTVVKHHRERYELWINRYNHA